MKAPWSPMRWPSAWTDPTVLALLKGSGIDTLLIDNSDEFEPVRSMAERQGLQVVHPDTPPDGVTVAKGAWPGVRRSRRGADTEAGPTGVPWVDSNGWTVLLAAAMHPGRQVWVDAKPPDFPNYLTAIADSAAYGGRWIVTLDEALATGIAAQQPRAMATWKTITQASSFFAAHSAWNEYAPVALAGVVSDFTGPNEFFSQELLNLLARAGLHFVVLPKHRFTPEACRDLRTLIYADAQPPSAELRRHILDFVQPGGTLITFPSWGAGQGKVEHRRYIVSPTGEGWIARSITVPDDPYVMANDAWNIVSHRYDLVRFWNAGATASYYAASADRKQAIVHLLFFADRGPDAATVRIAGPYRHVKASTVNTPSLSVETVEQKDALEIHLPQVQQYVALELSL
jgi:hypothetical protein